MIYRKCVVRFALYFVLFSFLSVPLLVALMSREEIDKRIPNNNTSSFKPECITLGRKVLSQEPSKSLQAMGRSPLLGHYLYAVKVSQFCC